MTLCPTCNTENIAGSAFCDNCGTALLAAPRQGPSPSPVAAGAVTTACPTCGHNAVADQAFCDSCGAQLAAAGSSPISVSHTAPPAPPLVTAQGSSAPLAKLLILPAGSEIALPSQPELIVGRNDAGSGHFPEIDLDNFDAMQKGVGRRHARMLMQGGQVLLEDLDSVNGTLVNRQKLVPRRPQALNDGDEIRFGTLVATFRCR